MSSHTHHTTAQPPSEDSRHSSESIREVACRDGRTFRLRPSRTALIIVDMQRDFCQPGGYGSENDADATLRFGTLIPVIEPVLKAAREAGLQIIATREGHAPDLSDITQTKLERSIAYGSPYGAQGPMGRVLIRGEYGHDIVDELQPAEGDIVVDKTGYSAFHQTELATILQERGIEDLVFVGVTTDVCVFSTLREAVDRGYRSLLLEDCTDSFKPGMREATITMIESEGGVFGWVASSSALLRALKP
jgi:nicotinamidase-related amidase